MGIAGQQGQLSSPNWTLSQLAKSGLYRDEQAVLRGALRALFRAKPQVRLRMIVSAYQSGDVSLGKAAAMLGVSQEEMKDILRDAGVAIHLRPHTVDEVLEAARNA
jgi:predicted HTH domain antitoxin